MKERRKGINGMEWNGMDEMDEMKKMYGMNETEW